MLFTSGDWRVDVSEFNKDRFTTHGIYEFENAKDYAKIQSKDSQLPVYIWKLTTGNPIKWMEVS